MTSCCRGRAAQVIVSHDMIGRMMLLAARSPWLATVLDGLMGFEGSELYVKEWPALVRHWRLCCP